MILQASIQEALCIYVSNIVYVVDSQLAKETNIGVQEMMNGCLCCVLVGQMKLALLELKGNIIINNAFYNSYL